MGQEAYALGMTTPLAGYHVQACTKEKGLVRDGEHELVIPQQVLVTISKSYVLRGLLRFFGLSKKVFCV